MEYGCGEDMCSVQYCSEKCALENQREHLNECLANIPTKASSAIHVAVRNGYRLADSQIPVYQVNDTLFF